MSSYSTTVVIIIYIFTLRFHLLVQDYNSHSSPSFILLIDTEKSFKQNLTWSYKQFWDIEIQTLLATVFFSEFTLRPELSNLAFHPWYLRYNSSSLSTICRSSASIFNNTSSPSPAFSTLQQNDWKKWYKCRRWVEYPIKGKDGSSHAQCIRLHHL